MLKKIIAFIVIFIGISYWAYHSIIKKPLNEEFVADPLNTTYIIEGEEFTLLDGRAEKEIVPGAASKMNVNVFDGWTTTGDINNDGLDDTVVLLTYNAGGSGTFYYVALALKTNEGYRASNTIFIGDRISPQTTEIKDNTLIVNYADRYPWESFTTTTSVGKSKYLIFEDDILKEISGEILSQDIAYALVVGMWGDYGDDCEELIVSVLDGKDGVWFVQAIYNGLRDDSVYAQKKIAWAHYLNDAWEIGAEILEEYKCQPNRGHQDFSDKLCL